jgi:AraC-like DNA-binding protein
LELIKEHIYNYLTISEDDKKLGLYLIGAGYTSVSQGSEYPLCDHPAHHYFQWAKGRRIADYQMLYIVAGKGMFESEHVAKRKINAGDVFFLFPNEWHRFCPDKKTGWKEYWIEFNGLMMDNIRKVNYLTLENPVYSVGVVDGMIEKFIHVNELIDWQKLSLQFSASATIFQILCDLFASRKFNTIENTYVEEQIINAKLLIIEHLETRLTLQKVAEKVGMSYSLFRKEFKKYTGFSPHQYQIQVRIQRSKRLLSDTSISIKEIAYELGFESSDYFSRLFKKKVGVTPVQFRDKSRVFPVK